MKEDLEARERGDGAGVKRSREEEEGMVEMRRLAEEGRKRRAERERMMGVSSPAPAVGKREESPAKRTEEKQAVEMEQEQDEEDEVAVLERPYREGLGPFPIVTTRIDRAQEVVIEAAGASEHIPDRPLKSRLRYRFDLRHVTPPETFGS